MRPKRGCGVRPLLLHCHGIGERVGVSPAAGQGPEARQAQGSRGTLAAGDRVEAHADRAASKADRRSLIAESSGPEDFKYPWLSLARVVMTAPLRVAAPIELQLRGHGSPHCFSSRREYSPEA